MFARTLSFAFYCLATLFPVFCLTPQASGQTRNTTHEERLLGDELGPRYYIWRNDEDPGKFIPAGWMPDGAGLSQSTSERESPHSAPHCLRLYCQLSQKPWVGIYFLHEGAWEPQEAVNLFHELHAEKGDRIVCRLWARSQDQTSVQFKVGGVTKGKVKDSLVFPIASPWIRLEPEWKMYEIDITGKDVRSLVGGLVWTCDRQHNQSADITFDLDDIYFVRVKPKASKEER
jgi:hypothetical protein